MQQEETGLTLNEEGLKAVKGFLNRVISKEDDTQQEQPQPDIWEPPIDNEV